MNAAELDSLGAETSVTHTLTTTAGTGTPPPAAAPALTEAQEWAQIPATAGAIFSSYLPELAAVYTPEACDRWGAAFAVLAKRYGWQHSRVMEWLGPIVPCVLATVPLAVPTVKAFRAKLDAIRAEKEKALADPPPAA